MMAKAGLAALACIALSVTACNEDYLSETPAVNQALCFEVASNGSWASASTRTQKEEPQRTIYSLVDETGSELLYLHAITTDGFYCDDSVAESSDFTSSGADYSDSEDDEDIDTRATQVTSVAQLGSFKVYGYRKNADASSTAELYMEDVITGNSDGTSWSSDKTYYWPGSQYSMRFYAYAPSDMDETLFSCPETTFSYTVPSDVADQQDLMFAAAGGDLDGGYIEGDPTSTSVNLTFNHLLTAVKFVVGSNINGTVESVALNGVYCSGTFDMDADPSGSAWGWDLNSQTNDFEQTVNTSLGSSPADGTAITAEAQTFMMMPQTLPEGAEIEINYTDSDGTEQTLTADISGYEWPIGTTVTYKLSISNSSVVFTVSSSLTLAYTGGTGSYTVTSYTQTGETQEAEAWTARYVELVNDQYVEVDAPEWITSIVTSGSGSAAGESCSLTATASTKINKHNEVLQNTAAISGVYDLSTAGGTTSMNTANCYIVNAPGTYCFPLVYGNAIKDGSYNEGAYESDFAKVNAFVLTTFVNHNNDAISDPYIANNSITPKDAVLVWQDEENLVSDISLTGSSATDYRVQFTVASSTIKQGNAVIAVRNSSGVIVWSWHIWVTDYKLNSGPEIMTSYDPDETQVDRTVYGCYNEHSYIFMGVPLGWCDGGRYPARETLVEFTQTNTGEKAYMTVKQSGEIVKGNNPSYQWGRKDPMLPSVGSSATNKTHFYDNSSYAFTTASGTATVGASIKNPNKFYLGSSSTLNWCACNSTVSGYIKSTFRNLWNINRYLYTSLNLGDWVYDLTEKTIYDPSPVGYAVPPGGAICGWTYDRGDVASFSGYINSPYTSFSQITTNKGCLFYCRGMEGKTGNFDKSYGMIFFPLTDRRSRGTGTLGIDEGHYFFYGYRVEDEGYNGADAAFNTSKVSVQHASGRANS